MSSQERLKKTNKLVKKAPKAVQHSHSTGELRAEANGQSSGTSNQLARNDRSPQNFAALLKSLGSAKRSSLGKGNSPSPGQPLPSRRLLRACFSLASVLRLLHNPDRKAMHCTTMRLHAAPRIYLPGATSKGKHSRYHRQYHFRRIS